MKDKTLAIATLAATLLGSTTAFAQYGQYGPRPSQPQGYSQGPGGWDAPPREFHEFGRQGFHDGMEGAHRDVENRRRPDVRNRDEFRHPHVPGWAKDEYRQGFRRGYDVAMRHILGGPRPY